MMFAVIRAGGKQYRVAAEDVIRIDRVTGEPGQIVEFGEVLLLGGDTPQIGTPMVAGATVAGEVLQHTRGDKVIAFKKRRRKNSRRKRGHRQDLTIVRITQILTGGAEPATAKAAAAPRSAEAPAPEAAKTAEAATAKPAAAAKAEAPAGAAGTEAAETAGLAASKAKRPKKAAPPKTGARRDDHEG